MYVYVYVCMYIYIYIYLFIIHEPLLCGAASANAGYASGVEKGLGRKGL